MTSQVCEVIKPLASVSRICKKGRRVVFEEGNNYTENLCGVCAATLPAFFAPLQVLCFSRRVGAFFVPPCLQAPPRWTTHH